MGTHACFTDALVCGGCIRIILDGKNLIVPGSADLVRIAVSPPCPDSECTRLEVYDRDSLVSTMTRTNV